MVYHISLQLWELAQLVLRGVGVLESTASAVSLVETAKSELTTSRNRKYGPEQGRRSRDLVRTARRASPLCLYVASRSTGRHRAPLLVLT